VSITLDEALALLRQGKDPREISAALVPEAERELLRRCAIVRAFDRPLVEEVLRPTPSPIRADEVPFERLAGSPFVEPVPGAHEIYRVAARERAGYLKGWTNPADTEGLKLLSAQLVEYYRARGNALDELYHLPRVDPGRALARFEELYDRAEAAFDLARCAELLGLFAEGRGLPAPLLRSRDERQAWFKANTLWAEDLYRTGRYLDRDELTKALNGLLELSDPKRWVLQLYAPGGSGKTMFLRWAVARACVPRRIPVARIDFDDANALRLVQEPWRLALDLAGQWNQQLVGEPLREFVQALAGSAGPTMTQPLQQLAAHLAGTAPAQGPLLLLLDTLEEVLLPQRGTLVALLRLLGEFHAHCPRLVLLLAGRYDLRARLGADFGAIGEAAIDREVTPFTPAEARQYLQSVRGLAASETFEAVIERAEGNPLKLALYADILKADPGLSAAQVRADSKVDVAYLIRRVVLRLPDSRLRWVLRYGAVPRRLTRDFLIEVMAGPLRREITGQEAADDPSRGLSASLNETDPFPRAAADAAIDFGALWEQLKQFAAGAAWVRVATDAGGEEALLFTPDVLQPMRALLLEQEDAVFFPLHEKALAYYRQRAEKDAGNRLRWLRECIYHDFQRRGEAAGAAWREWLESEAFRTQPAWRKELAEEVVGRAYTEDDTPPRPLRHRDGSRMIAQSDLVLAYYHLTAAHIDLARANPAAALSEWKEAAAAFGLLELANLNLHEPMPRAAGVAIVRALLLADRGEVNSALALLRIAQTLGDADERLRALREIAALRARLGRRDALKAYTELLGHWVPPVERVDVLGRYARVLLHFDQIEEALQQCTRALDAAAKLHVRDDEDQLGPLYRQILLRQGCPAQASKAAWLVGPGVPKEWAGSAAEVANGFAVAEALLDQRCPREALANFRRVRDSWQLLATFSASPPLQPQLPLLPAVLELRGRIAGELLDVRRALDRFDEAQSGWVSRLAPADADRVLVRIIELHLRGLGDLRKAESLLHPVLQAGTGVPSESDVRLELLRAELRGRAGAVSEAGAIVDALRTRLSPDWPPRFCVWLALEGLACSGEATAEPYFQLLVDALAKITPAAARAALLAPLERVATFKELPPPQVDRFLALLPDPADADSRRFPRDQALHDLRVTEALRVVGRRAEAAVRLNNARDGLLIGSETLFPLRELLLAADRLGYGAEAFDEGAPLLPRFRQEFADCPLLCASLLHEQARRALRTKDPAAGLPLLDQADDLLRDCDRALTVRLEAVLAETRAHLAAALGDGALADRHRSVAVASYKRLGITDPRIQLALRAGAATKIVYVTDAGAGVDTGSVPPLPLQPRPPSFTINVRPAPNGGLVIETAPPTAPSSEPDPAAPRARTLSGTELLKFGLRTSSASSVSFPPEGIAPFGAVNAFAADWRLFANLARELLLPPPDLKELETANRAPTDLRLEVAVRSLHPLPFEFLTRSGEPGAFLARSDAVRYFYRAAPAPESGPISVKWLQDGLRRLGAPALVVDGVDSPELRQALRAFQTRVGLAPTGQANAKTRWFLYRHLRGLPGSPGPSVLLIAPERGEQFGTGARDLLSQQGIDLAALYQKVGYVRFAARGLGPEDLRNLLQGRTPSIVHVAAGLSEDPSLGVLFYLARPDADREPGLNFLTASFLDQFLKSVPETELPPLVILDPPWSPSPVERVRQLFLRNAFAADLFQLGHAPVVLGTGLGRGEKLESLIETVLGMLARGETVGAVADEFRRSAPPGAATLDDILHPAGTALWAYDPESRAPGAGPAISPAPLAQGAKPVTRAIYALLVGIDKYPSPIPPLHGCVNDIEAFAAYLAERVDKDKGITLHVEKLLNEHATRQAVLDTFRSHLGQARAGDVALFCYSGHGSQEQAPEEFWPLEPDHLDETLVCHDSRQAGSWDLADKELAKLIADVAAQEPHVAVLLDCCHSGSGTRNVGTVVRRAPTDLRRRPLDSFIVGVQEALRVATRDAGPGHPGGTGVSRGRHVLLAACRDNEEAKEYTGDGKQRGAFSFFLGDTLRTAAGAPTYRDLFARAAALVSSQFKDQSPQLEATQTGDLDAVFLDGAIRPTAAAFTAGYRNDAWFLNGGAAHGIPAVTGAETTTVALYPFDAPAEDLRTPAKALGTARVAEVQAASSRIEPAADIGLDPKTTYKAVIISLPAPALAVRLEGDAAACELVRKDLAKAGPDGKPSPFVREAGADEQPKFRLLARDGQYVIARPGDDRQLVAQINGLDEAGARLAVSRLEHIGRWTQTAELKNPASTIKPDELKVSVFVEGKEVPAREIRLEYQQKEGKWVPPRFKICMTNSGKRRLYCALLDLTEMFKVSAGLQAAGCVGLEPGETAWALDGREIPASVPDALWKLGVVEYKDLLKVIIATEEFDARLLEQGALDAPTTKAVGTRAKPRNSSLNRLMRRVQTRDLGDEEPAILDDWQTAELSFTTVRPQETTPVPTTGQSAPLPGGVRLQGHAALKANARLATEPLATRDLGGIALPRLLVEDPAVCLPFAFTSSRGTDPGLSVLELTDVADSSVVTPDAPLRLTVPIPLAANEHVLPVASDGEFFLPLGRVTSRSATATEIAIDRLPPPLVDSRSLGGAIKIFFEKVISRVFGAEFPYPLLAAADVAADGTVQATGDLAEVRRRVAAARRVVVFVHGIIGDTRSMVPAVQLARRADGSPVAGLYDLVLTFDYENLNTTIEDNGRALKKRLEEVGLGAGHGKILDIVAHSMGGLVSRWFIEREGGNQLVRRLIMLGTPNAGSPWPRVVDWATLALAFGLNHLTAIAWPVSVLGSLTSLIENPTVALNEMTPDSGVLKSLAGSADPGIPYLMLAGNTSLVPAATAATGPKGSVFSRLLARLTSSDVLHKLADPFFVGQPNDIAVSVRSMESIAAGRKPAYDVRPVACDHISYFRDPAGLQALAKALEGA
jgi:hypothetical protein